MSNRRAVFLDRDGTLIDVVGENGSCRPANNEEEVKLLPGVIEGIERLKQVGFTLVVVTNQGGIAHGYLTAQTLHKQHERINDLLEMAGAPIIDAYYWCPHATTKDCACRKPKPGMILSAARDLNIDLSMSFIIGDDVRDIEAGAAAGLRKKIMVISDRFEECKQADLICSNFYDAAEHVAVMGAYSL